MTLKKCIVQLSFFVQRLHSMQLVILRFIFIVAKNYKTSLFTPGFVQVNSQVSSFLAKIFLLIYIMQINY